MVNILRQNDITILEMGADYRVLDEPHIGRIVQQMVDVAKHATPPLVVLDISHAEEIDSFFVQFLIRIWKLLKKRDGRLVLVGLQPECLRVLRRDKLESLWERFETREGAIQALRSDQA